jgi:hypothetical protein
LKTDIAAKSATGAARQISAKAIISRPVSVAAKAST